MQSACLKEVTQVFLHDCCPAHFLSLPDHHQPPISKSRSTSATCRRNFAATTASSFFPDTHFTNHESLPSLQESHAQFTKAYPHYMDTTKVDQIRAQEYRHLTLSRHICLDYIGIGLFSHAQIQTQTPSSSSSSTDIVASSAPPPPPPLPPPSDFPFFNISYKSVNLRLQLLHGGQGSELESAIRKRIMEFLNVSENDYSMVFTTNRSSAFKLLAESYPFQSSRRLLTVYDYESEAVEAMVCTSQKRGARVMSAEFSWPRLRIHSVKLRNMIVGRRRKKKKKRGLFVFPLHSRMTGASYSYQWMSIAQENGWHVLLDACALGPKDMDSFGLSLFRPDFLICSFYKVFGETPTGVACLFVKKSTVSVLESSTSTGIVNLVSATKQFQSSEYSSGTDTDLEQASNPVTQQDIFATSSASAGPASAPSTEPGRFDHGETSEICITESTEKQKRTETSEAEESEKHADLVPHQSTEVSGNRSMEIKCNGLDHVDSLGLTLVSSRARYLINWLVNALMKLHHPNTEEKVPLVRIYGPKIKFDRGPALAFNVYDWKGEKVEPVLVQKLADRSNISLSYGFLHQIWFSDKYKEEEERVMEKETAENKRKIKAAQGIRVVTAALGFLANFEDTYRLWVFVSQFLDADFVEKERWRYTALNQKTIEI